MERPFALKDLERMWICGTCADLNGILPPRFEDERGLVQRCRCRRDPDEPRWPHYDFNEVVHLCECCRMKALRSGSKWSVWFCDECSGRVKALNDRLRVWLIPIGRHSFMVRRYDPPGHVMLDGSVLRTDEATRGAAIDHFARGLLGMANSIGRLGDWSTAALLEDLRALGFAPGAEVRLSEYLKAARARAREDQRFTKLAAFRRLEAHMRGSG